MRKTMQNANSIHWRSHKWQSDMSSQRHSTVTEEFCGLGGVVL